MGLRKIFHGNGDIQFTEQNMPSGRLRRLHNGKYMKFWPEKRRNGLYKPENAILGPFSDFPRLQAHKRLENEEDSVQQAVPGYDPQVVAMQSLLLAAIVYSTVVGRA